MAVILKIITSETYIFNINKGWSQNEQYILQPIKK